MNDRKSELLKLLDSQNINKVEFALASGLNPCDSVQTELFIELLNINFSNSLTNKIKNFLC